LIGGVRSLLLQQQQSLSDLKRANQPTPQINDRNQTMHLKAVPGMEGKAKQDK
jgi:hypothetical protein